MQSHRLALMLHESAMRLSKLCDPDDGEIERVAARIAENFEIVPVVWQRSIAGVLAPMERIPDRLIETFISCDASVAGPFIAVSPALSEPALLELIGRHGADGHTRAIARRANLSQAVKQALRALKHPAIDRALELRQTAPTDDRQGTPDHLSQTIHNAGQQAEIAALSGAQNGSLFATALADRTGLSMASARILCDDPTSKNLLFALRFMGLDTKHAEQVLRNLTGAGDLDESVLQRFRAAYGSIDRLQAAERVRSWQLDELRSLALQQSAETTASGKQSRDVA